MYLRAHRLIVGGLLLAATVANAGSATEAWSRSYNGPGNRDDELAAIAVGSDGSIYVAGTSYEVGQQDNLMLLKYSPSGDLLWDTIINGPDNLPERPRAIVLDSDDNILVAGPAWNTNGVLETVWKFEPESGTLLWDYAIPGLGFCPVFGECGAALAVTPNNEILLGGWQFQIAKLTPSGAEIWTRSVKPAPDVDLMNDIAVAPDGRILCGGVATAAFEGSGVVAYDADGNFLWSDQQLGNHGAVFGPAHVAFDDMGNAIAAFEPETSCGIFGVLLAKYDVAGNLQWVEAYSQVFCETFDLAELAVANANEIYVVGSLGGSADIGTVKFNGNGAVVWERAFNGPLNSTDIGNDLALDALGNVYVGGTVLSTGAQDRDMVAISYDPAGNLRWSKAFDGGSLANDVGLAIDTSTCSRVYLAGHGWHPPNQNDVFLTAYDQALAGDFDGDGDADSADFAILQGNFGKSAGASQADGDTDNDGDVDLADLNAYVQCVTGPTAE
ncbi:MAG: PQQ-binding-like beta-propeller repeat protein [Phycisphaerales bacterium]|nr:PQQ-binding-like beta-propeller repeat protein [Phycisphaerales bacterium]